MRFEGSQNISGQAAKGTFVFSLIKFGFKITSKEPFTSDRSERLEISSDKC